MPKIGSKKRNAFGASVEDVIRKETLKSQKNKTMVGNFAFLFWQYIPDCDYYNPLPKKITFKDIDRIEVSDPRSLC